MFNGPLPVASTFSKDPKMFAQGFEPVDALWGEGACIFGSDGKKYIDWISALGANILGYCTAADGSDQFYWLNEVQIRLNDGVAFSLPHRRERLVAEKLVAFLGTYVPGWQPEDLGVRFGLSGTDATTMAVRLARAVRGKTRIVSVGYHGWSDMFVSTTPPAHGVSLPQYVESAPFGDIDALQRTFFPHSFAPAAVIIEQSLQEPEIGYWTAVRNLCTEHGALLILDEIVTWPRYALGGAAEFYGIHPDICCYGKALGNGFPISCIVGKREYFEWFARTDPCFVSSTGFGNAASLAAADVLLDIWNQKSVNRIWHIGGILQSGLQKQGYSLSGNPPRMLIEFPTLAHKTYFTLGMRDRGILWNRPTLPNLAHTEEDVSKTLAAAKEIAEEMANVDVETLMADKLPMVLFSGR